MTERCIRPLGVSATLAVVDVYRAAASLPSSGLARAPDEITPDYVREFLERACSNGVTLGAFVKDQLVGEVHAARLGPRQFNHVLGDLTVAVHPSGQGTGIGSALFAAFFKAAGSLSPAITRVELMARSGNIGALRLYERLGFVQEGRLVGRVSLPDGSFEDDILMARSL
ncbi:MAG: GNAT family N-acetyltransferase [Pseudomonadota bacterium]|nr:GNAT family N-acetyltransferase [Pseudomonadota bacterium]